VKIFIHGDDLKIKSNFLLNSKLGPSGVIFAHELIIRLDTFRLRVWFEEWVLWVLFDQVFCISAKWGSVEQTPTLSPFPPLPWRRQHSESPMMELLTVCCRGINVRGLILTAHWWPFFHRANNWV